MCKGKNAAKRKFKVYPSAYANAYASKICAGKIKDPSGLKRKDFKGPKKKMSVGKRVGKPQGKVAKGCGAIMADRKKELELLSDKYKKQKGKRPEEV